MSVINTMLEELDRRGAPRAALSAPAVIASERQSTLLPRGQSLRRGAAALIFVIGGLANYAVWSGRIGDPTVLARPAEPSAVAKVAVLPEAPVAGPAPEELLLQLALSMEMRPHRIPVESSSTAKAAGAVDIASLVASNPPAAGTKSREETQGSNERAARAARLPAPQAALSPAPSAPSAPAPGERARDGGPRSRADMEFRRAADEYNQGRPGEAVAGFRAAVAEAPANDAYRQALVGALLATRQTGEAEQVLAERLARAFDHPGFATVLARLQAERGEHDAAVQTLQSVLPSAASNPTLHATLAALLARRGAHVEAIAHYRTALGHAPGAATWWLGLALSLQAADRQADARDALQRAKTADGLSAELLAFVEQRLRQLQ